MAKLSLLLRLYYKNLFGLNRLKYSRKPHAGLKRAGILIGAPLLALCVMGFIGVYCALMAQILAPLHSFTVIPVAAFILDALFTLINSLSHGSAQLLTFRDYDIQMSLPVSPGLVALSRLLIAYLEGLASSLITLLPACCVYIYYARPGAAAYAVLFLSFFLAPALPIIVGTALSAFIARFSARFRAARYLRLALSLGLMATYLSFTFSAGQLDEAKITTFIFDLSGVLTRLYPPAELFARALDGSLASLFALIALSLGAFAVMSLFYARSLRRLHSAVTENRAHSRFRMRRLSSASPLRALYRRELSHYFSSTIYVLNTAIGPLMGIVAGIALLLMGREPVMRVISALPFQITGIIPLLIPCVFVFLLSTCVTTASSISLEGSSLWILQSIPVPTRTIFRAKLLLNLTVLSPLYTVVPLLILLALRPGVLPGVLLFLTPFFAGIALSELGLLLNLRLHRFDWKNEQQIVKQSAPVSLVLLASLPAALAPAALILLFPDRASTVAVLTAVFHLLVSLVFGFLLRRRAARGLSSL